ncbi:hypothetical protein PGT21_014164 [Puccinia graminis f. sp. tritici]|uniref:Uncharacterized protein n=1 Tax=Puccinia graminis f. sp. tritici TaxID=56615 RepID=A0A5B0Q5P9_PUCGR|nr:hypothetical protein PGT21_014164 [Puccinia graminis f. sp. tritici]KAA1138564.1 hypothetical protein PGTUg99_029213 [Puccinia graminis f. sp. tritici]
MLVRLAFLGFFLLQLQAALGAPAGSVTRRSNDDSGDVDGGRDCDLLNNCPLP